MPIMLPLTLLGVGYLISQLFTGATLALPIAIGVGTGLSAHQLGASPLFACAFGILAFMMTIAQAALPRSAWRIPMPGSASRCFTASRPRSQDIRSPMHWVG